MPIDKDYIDEICSVAWEQLNEDREAIKDLYDHLKRQIVTREEYAINGQNLAKFAELMIKQTGQVVDLLKVMNADKSKDEGGLTADDIQKIHDQLKEPPK